MVNFYTELDIDPNLKGEELKKELTRKVRKWNQRLNAPDREKQHEAEKKLELLGKAFSILLDEKKRAEYDSKLNMNNQSPNQFDDVNRSSPSYQQRRRLVDKREKEWKRIEEEYKKMEEEKKRQQKRIEEERRRIEEEKRKEEERKQERKQKEQLELIEKNKPFKIITTLISVFLIILPCFFEGEDASLLIYWGIPVFIFGTIKGFSSHGIHLKEKIGIIILQIIMPSLYPIAYIMFYPDKASSALLLMYGGGILSHFVGRVFANV